MSKQILIDDFRFNGACKPPVAASVVEGPWASKVTAANGTCTVSAVNGSMNIVLDTTNEVQNACLYFGDILPYDIDDLVQIDIWASLTALDASASPITGSFGLATARNDAIGSIAESCLFQVTSGNALSITTADSVITNSQLATTGFTLGSTFQKHTISFKEGINTVSPPGLSTGGKSNILFSVEDVRQNLRRIQLQKKVDMSNYSGNLQLFAQLQKTAAAKGATLSIKRFKVQYRQN